MTTESDLKCKACGHSPFVVVGTKEVQKKARKFRLLLVQCAKCGERGEVESRCDQCDARVEYRIKGHRISVRCEGCNKGGWMSFPGKFKKPIDPEKFGDEREV